MVVYFIYLLHYVSQLHIAYYLLTFVKFVTVSQQIFVLQQSTRIEHAHLRPIHNTTQRVLCGGVKRARVRRNRLGFYSCVSCVHALRRIVNQALV